MNPDIPETVPPTPTAPRGTDENGTAWTVPPEVIPNLDVLVIEDGKPVDSIFAEKQMRLLTTPLYTSWSGPGEGKSFVALSNVGLFFAWRQPPLCPDVMLAIDVQWGQDLSRRENRSYFVWERGKVPDVVIEIVSDRTGGEDGYKRGVYARWGVPNYVIFDPEDLLKGGVLRVLTLRSGVYEPLEPPLFPQVGLGLMLWEGEHEGWQRQWLRWCDLEDRLIPTGRERTEAERRRAEQEHERAEQERHRAEQLAAEVARLRALLEERDQPGQAGP
jgi:hypothetical protein